MYPSNKKKKLWREEKERLFKMTLEERRKEYLKGYVSLKEIPSWMEEVTSKTSANDENPEEEQEKKNLGEKVSLYRGDITLLEVDAIVNAANSSLCGGGGVDGCIHRASGSCLLAECRSLSGCETGQAKMTCGYDLPAKYVIHTVGPIARGHLSDSHKDDLASCYKSSLKLAKENNIRSIAFPCISTGIYGFPNEPAASIALTTIKEWLKKNHNEMDRIIYCVFLEVDYKIYKKKISEFFPKDDNDDGGNDEDDDDDKKEDIDQINENIEGMNQKAQSPPMKKSKGKKAENVKDSKDDDNVTDDNVTDDTNSAVDLKGLSSETDEEKPGFPSSTSEDGTGLPKDTITEIEGSKGPNKLKDGAPAEDEMTNQDVSEETAHTSGMISDESQDPCQENTEYKNSTDDVEMYSQQSMESVDESNQAKEEKQMPEEH
ncbi:ADP-ribose glycohydrolase MACROD2 isoform X2 [Ascaphus truei]|uniref:ADP-ribose glycohydrolase MACROD2 isoform X2 n=1 Tax=Ascaphus truei TaxID=8439 RepID=UPI003F59F274